MPMLMLTRLAACLMSWAANDLDPKRRAGLACDGTHGYEIRVPASVASCSGDLETQSTRGRLYVFRGKRGDLIKIIWHDGQGACLFAKRLERGRFIWPSMADGVVTISVAQMSYLLSGIDWRHPQETWRPQAAGLSCEFLLKSFVST